MSLILAVYPSDFRSRRGDELLRLLRYDLAPSQGGLQPLSSLATLADALWAGLRLRFLPGWTLRRPAHSQALAPDGRGGDSGGRPPSVPPFTSQPGSANMFDQIRQDLAYAFRNLIRRPGWTLAALATLALGIGATTSVFSLVNDVLLRPLPYPQAERLVELRAYIIEGNRLRGSVSYPVCRMMGEAQEALEDFGCYTTTTQTLKIDQGAERIRGGIASWEVMEALRVPPLKGRAFGPEDDEPDAQRVMLLSFGLWQERFGASDDVIGQTIRLAERPFTVIGVMPEGFVFPDEGPRYWISLAGLPRTDHTHYLSTLGRLKPDWTPQRAEAHFDALRLDVPTGAPGETGEIAVRHFTLLETLVGEVRPQLWIFLSAVAAVLLIACINVANLLLSRMAGRTREMALRSALGAGRRRLLIQMLSESTLLALLGGAAGLVLALVLSTTLRSMAAAYVPRSHLLGLDNTALLFAAALSLLVGMLIGLLPALRASRPDLSDGLRESARGSAGSRRHHRLRAGLVVAQVALAMTLLINAGLLVRSFQRLASTDVGFKTADLITVQPALPMARYREEAAALEFFRQTMSRLEVLPGVESVALAATLPFAGGHIGEGIRLEGTPAEEEDALADVQVVSPEFFPVLGLSPLQGRLLTPRDREGTPVVVVVNETLARQLFPQGQAVGQRFTLGSYERSRQVEIVGVVPDTKLYRLTREIRPMVYESALQNRMSLQYSGMLLRAAPGAASALIPQVRETLQSVDASVPMIGRATVDEHLSGRLSNARFRTLLLGAFGITALLLAMIGVYGVMAYGVTRRIQEIGVRMALGARRGQILTWVIRRGLLLTSLGLALGLGGALATSHLLESYLHQLSSHDQFTYAAAVSVLFLAALLAAFLPARRASRTDPMEALRCE
ncbi:MAG TPA: ABC transporter permease [Acidobacteriota bacterium]|nr:ABC transporter permease [Acidobacteriota bacterium]